ncbi:MAG: RHS repeat-associated core domain-containing protein, partial [Desulfobacteraceae bacterium]
MAMAMDALRRLLYKDIDGATGLFVLVNAAADDIEIPARLDHPEVQKMPLCRGELALTCSHKAPFLLRVDSQPEIERWVLKNGSRKSWFIFFTSTADVKTLQAHFMRFFQLRTPENRCLYFRFYSPKVLEELLSQLSPARAAAFFGPVQRFIFKDERGVMRTLARADVKPDPSIDPYQVVAGGVPSIIDAWQLRLFNRNAQKYRGMGFDVTADEANRELSLTAGDGSKVFLQKTKKGVIVTTGEGRRFDYKLTVCGDPIEITDPAGHRIFMDIPDKAGPLHAIRLDEGRQSWIFDYDDANRLAAITYPDGDHACFGHGPYGHLYEWTDRTGHTTCFERDAHGRLTGLTDANGHKTEFAYDDLTAPARITFADGTAFDFEYTADGVLEKLLTAGGQVARYRVDKETGDIRVDYADGTWAEYEVRDDKIVRAANQTGTVELEYDDNGHPAKETFAGRTVTYQRNATGQLTSITTPFGQTIHYGRDSENRVSTIRDWSGEKIDIRYARSGVLESITYPNGTCLSQQSTAAGLPARLRLTGPGQAEPIFCKTYKRDQLERVVQIRDGDKQVDYRYDREGRLLQAQSADPLFDESFTMDAKANRLADKAGAYSISPADRISAGPAGAFIYDATGNLTRAAGAGGPAHFSFSALNHLQTAAVNGTQASYRYDAFGRRVEKRVNGIRTRFIWAGGQLLHEIRLDETGPLDMALQGRATDQAERVGDAVVIDYLFFPETPVLLALRKEGRKPLWAAFGHRYEVLCLTDEEGRPAWQAEYDAFGKAHIQKGHRLFQPLRLCGQYHDPETGLHYNQARYYDPSLGRYLSLDPLFLESGSPNFYAYCDGDPVNRIDPSGEFIFCAMLIGAAIGAAIGAGIEAWQQHSDGNGMDGFKIARAALLGGAIGAVGGGVGAAVEAALAAGTAGTALASGTLAGMGATGFLSGTAGSVAGQCAEAVAAGNAVSPLQIAKHALTDGVIGAGVGLATLGAGGFAAKRLRKAASALRPKLPTQRAAALAAKAKEKSRNLAARIKSAGAKQNGRSQQFCVSDPVDPITGQVVLDQEDFTLAGRIPLTWSRHYGSRSDFEGLLGRGWQCPADARLTIDPEGFVTFFDGTPEAAVFETLPEDEPVMEAANGALLEKKADGYRVRLKSGL